MAVENYFNYFTEIEECFRRCRGTPNLLSTLDWALIESWKEAGLPLEAVLLGIERAFEKFARRPARFRRVNSLAYCTQNILQAAEELSASQGGGRSQGEEKSSPAPFQPADIRAYLERNAGRLEKASRLGQQNGGQVLAEDLAESAGALRGIVTQDFEKSLADLEELERRLTAVEEKLTAALTRASSVESLTEFRREIERELARCRRTMTAAQIESLERQFLKKRLFEHYQVPRLSLFYL